MLQGQRDLATVGRMLLSELAPLVDAQQGVIYQMEADETRNSALCVLLSRVCRQSRWHHRERSGSAKG